MINIIVAYNQNFVIGNNLGFVPWHIKDDLRLFRETTMGHPCIMGKNTWNSLPDKFKPLPGRFNIIVTKGHRNFELPRVDNVAACGDIETAIALGKQQNTGQVFITGGAQVYRYCVEHELADRVLASEIRNHLDVEGATFFPDLKNMGWTGNLVKEYEGFNLIEYRKVNHAGNSNDGRTEGGGESACCAHDETIREQPEVH